MPTSPWNLPLYTDATAATPFENLFNGISNGLNSGLTAAVGGVADLDALAVLAPADFPGRLVSVTEGGAVFRSNGTTWVQSSVATFASAAARNSAYAKAAGAYLVTSAQSRVTTELWDRFYSGSSWIPQNRSEQPVLPSSISGTGVSLNANTGLITLSGSTTAVVNGCFTGDFASYRLLMQLTWGSLSNAALVLRAGGTNSTASVYDKTELLARNGGTSSSTSAAQTSWNFGASARIAVVDMTLQNPAVATPTYGSLDIKTMTNPQAQDNNNSVGVNGLLHRTSSIYDGFQLTSGVSMTGTIRVLGLL